MSDEPSDAPTVIALEARADPGGGAFILPELTLGVFGNDQPDHRIAVGGDRRAHRPLAAGEGWILPVGAEGTCEYDDPLSVLTVSLSGTLLEEVGFDARAGFDPHVGAHDPLALQMVRTVASLDAAVPRLYRETMHRALAAHLAHLLGNAVGVPGADEAGPGGAIDDRRLRRAIECVHDRLGENLSLERLAAEATMSPHHFARTFRKATGLSPLQHVIRERMRLARVLVETTTLSVVDVALRVGYEDVSRFRRHFKRLHGATPGAVRGH